MWAPSLGLEARQLDKQIWEGRRQGSEQVNFLGPTHDKSKKHLEVTFEQQFILEEMRKKNH